MQIEIEKKYTLTDLDHSIIKDKCEFKEEVILKDYYLDKDLILKKNNIVVRLRNGLYELKITHFNAQTQVVSSEEYDNEEEIEKILSKYSLETDDLTGILFIDTRRESYKYNYKGQDIHIDVEEFQYGTRYEIEIVYQEEGENVDRVGKEEELNKLIENFRTDIGLTAESDINTAKSIVCAMHQNIELYEIMTQNIIK
ncbi:CYTH domain-containing protein [Candidatus Gracilibacteria bacterium]|nr:CYTH domain-containing protein [Candidatus Gracilibacteria bacterium]